jgi:hypothetical protein
VSGLPGQIGRPKDESQNAREPGPAAPQDRTREGVDGDGDENRGQQERHGVLVVQADTCHESGRDPQPRPVIDQGLCDQDQYRGPREHVERRRRQQVTERHHHRGHGDHDSGQHLGGTAAAQQSGEVDREQHESHHREQ